MMHSPAIDTNLIVQLPGRRWKVSQGEEVALYTLHQDRTVEIMDPKPRRGSWVLVGKDLYIRTQQAGRFQRERFVGLEAGDAGQKVMLTATKDGYPTAWSPDETFASVVYLSYADADKKYLDELEKQLHILKHRDGSLQWVTRATHKMAEARLVIVLVSPDYMASSWFVREVLPYIDKSTQVLASRSISFFPVLVRPVPGSDKQQWYGLKAVPGGPPICERSETNVDAAWVEVSACLQKRLA